MTRRGRMAVVSLAVLAVYLLGYAVKVGEDNRRLGGALAGTQANVVDQLARILEQAALAEEAGQAAQGSVERILERVEGLDPELIRRAVDQASKATGRPIVGPAGPAGPPGPAGTSAPATSSSTATTTATAPGGTTTTTRPASTTTTRPAPTTTTTGCLVGIGRLLRVGC